MPDGVPGVRRHGDRFHLLQASQTCHADMGFLSRCDRARLTTVPATMMRAGAAPRAGHGSARAFRDRAYAVPQVGRANPAKGHRKRPARR